MTEEELAKHDSKTLLQLLLSADARCDALTAERDRLREALAMIDAIDPEHHIDGCALPVVRGLVLRMGETARAALKGETP